MSVRDIERVDWFDWGDMAKDISDILDRRRKGDDRENKREGGGRGIQN